MPLHWWERRHGWFSEFSSIASECGRTACSIVGVGWTVWRSQPLVHFGDSQENAEAMTWDGGLAVAFEGLGELVSQQSGRTFPGSTRPRDEKGERETGSGASDLDER